MYTVVPYRAHRTTPSLFNDNFFRSFFDMNDMMGSAGFRVDVRDDEKEYQLEAELPGVKMDAINLTVDQDNLTISADINSEKKADKGSYLYSERRTGHVSRSFSLEGIQQDNITASYEDGILHVVLPKAEPEQPKAQRRIAISCGGNQEKLNG